MAEVYWVGCDDCDHVKVKSHCHRIEYYCPYEKCRDPNGHKRRVGMYHAERLLEGYVEV